MTLRLGLGLGIMQGGAAFSPLNFSPAALYDQRGYLQGSDATASGTGDPVGIAIDSAQGSSFSGGNFFGLGDELFNSPTLTGPVTDAGGGEYDFNWTGGATTSVVVPNVLTAGRMYLVQFTISDRVSGSLAVSLEAFANGGTYNANGTYTVLVVAGGGDDIRFDRSGSTGQLTLSGVTVMEIPGFHAQSTNDAARPTLQANGTLNDDGLDDDLIVPITGTYSAYIAAGASLISDESVAMADDYDVLRDDFIGAIIVSGTLTADQKTQLASYWEVGVGGPIPGGTISPTSITVTEGEAFSQQFTASGGTAPYTWSITTGSLPGGLSLSTDTISGTPSGVEGDPYSFTIRATDDNSDYVDQAISGAIQTAVTPPNVADVFSADIYTGNAAVRSITNGIDLSGEGGLVWLKRRNSVASHYLFDTDRGALFGLSSDTTGAEAEYANSLTAFNSDGFSLGTDSRVNAASATMSALTFRKAPAFFDIVTYTGDGVAGRTVSHNLSSVPGMIIVKRVSGALRNWSVYHAGADASVPEERSALLNSTILFGDFATFNDTAPTSSTFTVSTENTVNTLGAEYIAYVFANNDVVRCGAYTGNGSATGPTVSLGFEPQFLMVKRADTSGDWWVYDSERSPSNPRTNKLLWNSNAVEDTTGEDVDFIASGFQPKTTATGINESGGRYVYMAIAAP